MVEVLALEVVKLKFESTGVGSTPMKTRRERWEWIRYGKPGDDVLGWAVPSQNGVILKIMPNGESREPIEIYNPNGWLRVRGLVVA